MTAGPLGTFGFKYFTMISSTTSCDSLLRTRCLTNFPLASVQRLGRSQLGPQLSVVLFFLTQLSLFYGITNCLSWANPAFSYGLSYPGARSNPALLMMVPEPVQEKPAR